MIETVIFDLDGVIIDSEPYHFLVEKHLFKELGVNISDDEHLAFVGTSSNDMWNEIKNKADIQYSVKELVNLLEDRYLKHLDNLKEIKSIGGVEEVILELYKKNYNLIIASSSSRKIINTVLQKLNLSTYFSSIVSGAELTNSKPNPAIFLEAAKLANSKPEKCLVIEDSENGVKAAKSAKMLCVGYKNPNSGDQNLNLADFIIADFKLFDITKFDI
jgi:HAD superfamily hydrolase (TIGR01509 family)